MKKLFTLSIASLLFISVNAQLIVATGSTAVPRMWHSSQMLANGKVVVFGGDNGNVSSPAYYSSAEIYNNGTWSATGAMGHVRDYVSSILLSNGNILAIGGQDAGGNETNTCEIYNATSGTWSATGSMTTARSESHVVMLNNGLILVAGGKYTNTCELYDQSTGTFTVTGSMNATRYAGFTLTKLPNGNVLATGGNNSATAEIFSVSSQTWNNVASNMTIARQFHQAILMTNNKVLIAGGDYTLTSEVFDPTTNTFTTAGPLAQYISDCEMVNLTNGKVLVYGQGNPFSPTDKGALQVFNPAANGWYSAGVVPINIFTASVYTVHKLQNGKILYVDGNWTTGNGANAYCYLVDPAMIVAGVEEQNEIADLSVYPNPASDLITINALLSNDGNIGVRISDVLGNTVMDMEDHSQNKQFQNQIDIGKLPSGIYFLSITSGNSTSVRKIIKN
jgi:hypothetical protein